MDLHIRGNKGLIQFDDVLTSISSPPGRIGEARRLRNAITVTENPRQLSCHPSLIAKAKAQTAGHLGT